MGGKEGIEVIKEEKMGEEVFGGENLTRVEEE